MKKLFSRLGLLSISLCLLFSACQENKPVEEVRTGPVKIAYIEGGKSVDASKIAASKITHISYASAGVKENKAYLTNEAVDAENIKKLTGLKESNSNLKVLLSVACRDWSKTFAKSEVDAKAFAKSVADLVKANNLDGVDINWGYPAPKNAKDTIINTEQSQTYAIIVKSVKEELTALGGEEKNYILSCAVETSATDAQNASIQTVKDILDYVILLTHNYRDDKIIIHQSALNPSDKYQNPKSTSVAVENYLKAGVPSEKIVISIPFYGIEYKTSKGARTGISDSFASIVGTKMYSEVKDKYVNKDEFYRYWDKVAQAPYVYNYYKNSLITYNDEESIKVKSSYVISNNLAGVSIWGYTDDPKDFLINALDQSLK